MEEARKIYGQIAVKPDQCRACRKCEKACPQHIPISSVMPEIAKAFSKEESGE